MDPWSKKDYSRDIRGASMVERRLSEVNPPSGRVPGRVLLVLPILEARRRWNPGEIAKKGSVFGGFGTREIYRQRGQPGGPPGVQMARGRGRTRWGPLAPLRASGSLRYADFLYIFLGISLAL